MRLAWLMCGGLVILFNVGWVVALQTGIIQVVTRVSDTHPDSPEE